MLSLYEFNVLSLDNKASYVWAECTFLLSYAESETHVKTLYYSPGPVRICFFVELSYHAGNNCIDGISSFKAPRLLEPYLDQVNIYPKV